MKKYLLVLATLAILMIPSIAYADTTEVAMTEVTTESVTLDDLTDEVFQAKNAALEKEFAAKHPDLYEAFKRTSDTPYGFNMNVNVTANLDYPETEEVNTLDIRRIFGQMYMNGYINLPKEEMEMKMDLSYDAGDAMSQSFKGLEVILKDDIMYMFNPLFGEWETEELAYSDMFEYTGNPMEQNNLGMIAPIADLMTKRETVDSTIYSLDMSDEDIKTIVDGYVGMPVYDELLAEMEAEGVTFDIPSIEIDYVIQNGVIRVQHTEVEMTVVADEVTVKMNIALDGEYYSYGLQKEIETPVLETQMIEGTVIE